MLTKPEEAAEEASGGGRVKVMELVTNDGSGPVSLRISVEPASELPNRPSEAGGVFDRRQDNSIFVGTGDIELDVEVDGNTGKRDVTLSYSGPVIEVVVTRNTIIYKDETEMFPEGKRPRESGEITIQQELKPADSLDELGGNTEVQVWGKRRGDRVIADVLVYRIVEG